MGWRVPEKPGNGTDSLLTSRVDRGMTLTNLGRDIIYKNFTQCEARYEDDKQYYNEKISTPIEHYLELCHNNEIENYPTFEQEMGMIISAEKSITSKISVNDDQFWSIIRGRVDAMSTIEVLETGYSFLHSTSMFYDTLTRIGRYLITMPMDNNYNLQEICDTVCDISLQNCHQFNHLSCFVELRHWLDIINSEFQALTSGQF